MPGVYRRVRSAAPVGGLRTAVFLDRDGVLIEDSGYLSKSCEIRHIAGSAEAVARLNHAGLAVVVVTNQSGVGRGFYGWQEFGEVQAALESWLAGQGAWLDGVWASPYHEEGIGEYRQANHESRKPNPGMLEDAARELGLRLDESWMVGDRAGDVEAGLRAGLAGVVHVRTGVGASAREEVSAMALTHPLGSRIRQAGNLAEAVGLILGVTNRNEAER